MCCTGHVEWFAPMLTRIANTVQAHRARLQSQPDSDILPLDLHISVFVTCLCDPETVPTIPNSDICIERPTSSQIFKEFSSPPLPCVVQPKKRLSTIKEKGGESERSSLEIDTSDEMTHEGDLEQGEGGIGGKKRALKGNLDWAGMEGGVGVCVSGPEGLIREMGNAVAGASLRGGMGRVGLHTELFAL